VRFVSNGPRRGGGEVYNIKFNKKKEEVGSNGKERRMFRSNHNKIGQ